MIMEEPIEESYFNWLCAKVISVHVPIYWELMRILYSTEFVWVVPMDENRMEDGLELREDFLRITRLENDSEWFNDPCSVFEVFVAFATRADFQTDLSAKDWFWIFMTNLNLDEYRQVSREDVHVINDILETFIWRTYDYSGHGGIFPMRWPKHDQRKIELWYQFFEYLDDQGLM